MNYENVPMLLKSIDFELPKFWKPCPCCGCVGLHIVESKCHYHIGFQRGYNAGRLGYKPEDLAVKPKTILQRLKERFLVTK